MNSIEQSQALSRRSKNVLYRMGFPRETPVEELCALAPEDITRTRGAGAGTVKDIAAALNELGLELSRSGDGRAE